MSHDHQVRHLTEYDRRKFLKLSGIATGLAWTSVGGEILYVETTTMKGKGSVTLTGQLGDVMKESAQAALTYLHANAERLHVPEQVFAKSDFHIHVPAAAIPKDGPSAGVTIVAALLSLLTDRPLPLPAG